MRRGGRILIFLVLIIVILIAVAFLVFGQGLLAPATPENVTPTIPLVGVVSIRQPIEQNSKIVPEALSTIEIPQSSLVGERMVTDPTLVVGKYAAYPLAQGMPITLDMVSDRPGLNQAGSQAATMLTPGVVAVSIPINRLSSMAYGIRDGDRVNVIATTLFVDVDSSFQSILPNNFGQAVNSGAPPESSTLVTLGSGGNQGPVGRAELDPVLNQAIYLIPSEAQRPRLVSQMIVQDVKVLKVGEFSLVPEPTTAPVTPGATSEVPVETPTFVPVTKPDIITLIVTPQDAIALTYLMYSGAKFTLTLRAFDDNTRIETEAATLQYILSQYAIPVPAKLPYSMEPRLNQLTDPANVNATPTPIQ